jgi:hypothetical protein
MLVENGLSGEIEHGATLPESAEDVHPAYQRLTAAGLRRATGQAFPGGRFQPDFLFSDVRFLQPISYLPVTAN